MTENSDYYDRRVLSLLARYWPEEGAICNQLGWAGFWPVFPLQRLHLGGYVTATFGSELLADVSKLQMTGPVTEGIIWKITPAGQARLEQLEQKQ